MKYPRSLKDKRYPSFIRNSIITQVCPKPEKIFPLIGLKNCEMKVSQLKNNSYNDCITIASFFGQISYYADTGKHAKFLAVIDDINKFYEFNETICKRDCPIFKFNNKCFIKISAKIKLNEFSKKIVGKERSLNKLLHWAYAYHKKHNDISPNGIYSLEDILPNINNQRKNPFLDCKVVFSSDGNKGYWDLATMSMRGVTSCMNWSRRGRNYPGHANKLVGTITDPYAGIIYITNGAKTKYGNKILARAVVRLVRDSDNGKFYLFIEQIYKQASSDFATDIFIKFLHSKSNIRVDTLERAENYINKYNIPVNKFMESIADLNRQDFDFNFNEESWVSYRDSGISYVSMPKFTTPKGIKKSDLALL